MIHTIHKYTLLLASTVLLTHCGPDYKGPVNDPTSRQSKIPVEPKNPEEKNQESDYEGRLSELDAKLEAFNVLFQNTQKEAEQKLSELGQQNQKSLESQTSKIVGLEQQLKKQADDSYGVQAAQIILINEAQKKIEAINGLQLSLQDQSKTNQSKLDQQVSSLQAELLKTQNQAQSYLQKIEIYQVKNQQDLKDITEQQRQIAKAVQDKIDSTVAEQKTQVQASLATQKNELLAKFSSQQKLFDELQKALEATNAKVTADKLELLEQIKIVVSKQNLQEEKSKAFELAQNKANLQLEEEIRQQTASAQALLTPLDQRLNKAEGTYGTLLKKTAVLEVTSIDGLPSLVISGVNVHVRSGTDSTLQKANGLGNLVIGYNESKDSEIASKRTGSHNLIIGQNITYSGNGNLAVGANHSLESYAGGILGGASNTTKGPGAAIISGKQNTASGKFAVAVGGDSNQVTGDQASTLSGAENNANGPFATVVGGKANRVQKSEFGISLGGFNNQVNAFFGMGLNGHSNIINESAKFALKVGGFQQTVSQVHQVSINNTP